MEILGIGPSEFVFIVIIALIVLGPKDMQKAGRSIGRWLNQLVRSDGWKAFQRTTNEIKQLPTNLMREANEEMRQLEKDIRDNTGASTFPRQPKPKDYAVPESVLISTPTEEMENTIRPPSIPSAPAAPVEGGEKPDATEESETPNQDA